MPFYTSKDALLQGQRASFRTQKDVDWKTEGKEIDKEGRRTYKKGCVALQRWCVFVSRKEGHNEEAGHHTDG